VIPRLHIITDDEVLAQWDFLHHGAGILEVGGNRVALHLRGPRTSGRVLHDLALGLKDTALGSGGVLVVNDRVDLALALNLSGAHLGQRSLPPVVARRLLGPHRLLGLSVHGAGEGKEGLEGEVDFLLAGTVFPSPSHPSGIPGGLARIREVREVSRCPVLAIGGITQEQVQDVLEAGAHGVAVKGGIWDTGDPIVATSGYLVELERGNKELEKGVGK